MSSDAVVFHVTGTRDAWLKAVYDSVGQKTMSKILQKVTLWKGSFDEDEVPEYPKAEADPLAVNFISRLSDNPRTHYKEFFEAIGIMRDRKVPFQAFVGDPNESHDGSPQHVTQWGPWSRDEYFLKLWQSTVVPILWPQWEMHSLGCCHAIRTENILVSPSGGRDEWHKIVPGVLIEGDITGEKLAEAMTFALGLEGEERYNVIEAQHRWLRDNRSIQYNIHVVRDELNRLAS